MFRKYYKKYLMVLFLVVCMFVAGKTDADAATVTAPPKVTNLTVASKSTLSVKLKWSKISNVNGYQVYRKTPDQTTWTKIATVSGSKYTYTNYGLKSNTKYQYKVRAYRTYKSGTVTKYKYGLCSASITVTTKKVLKSMTLQEGYYTAGVDIPVGVFDVKGVAGIGYIDSPFDAINMKGPETAYKKFMDNTRYCDNYKLKEGQILTVKGVTVKISYSSITKNASGRTYDESKGIILKGRSTSYVVGKDIAPGRYCIRYVSGEPGYVVSYRNTGDCIVGANLDGDSKTGEYVDYVSNIVLVKGEKFDISSKLVVKFIPEK